MIHGSYFNKEKNEWGYLLIPKGKCPSSETVYTFRGSKLYLHRYTRRLIDSQAVESSELHIRDYAEDVRMINTGHPQNHIPCQIPNPS